MAIDSEEFLQLAAEATDIAASTSQSASTVHLLLALFTVPGPAEVLLRERGCDEDALLAELSRRGKAPAEAESLYDGALARARQLADDCGNRNTEGLHLLVALTRLSRSAAAQLLERTAPPLAALRTTALGYLTGAVPRRKSPRQEVRVPASRRAAASVVPPTPSSWTGARATTTDPPQAPVEALATPRASPGPASPPSQAPPPALHAAAAPRPARWSLDPRQHPWLCAHGRNLSLLAAEGDLDAAVGREREVEELLDILGKRRANNPLLLGEPGVGKTAIVEGLARRLVDLSAERPEEDDRLLVELDVGGLVAGTALRGSFSERLLGIKEEVRKARGRIVVFIDELHMLIGAGATGEGPQDAANELKAALARGEFPCIGATTHDEYRRHLQGDPALERRFVPLLVREPSPREAQRILESACDRYVRHHGVSFAPEALEAACQLSARHVRDRFLPDKAFAAIDLAGSRARREGRTRVQRDDVARAIARMAGIPEERLLGGDGGMLLDLKQRLAARVVGHEEVLGRIASVLRRNRAGFSSQRPLASFLFAGPSGVGKTETALALAAELFVSTEGERESASGACVRVDLSEYVEPHSVARLVGAPPGYVGYGDGGQLAEAVRRRPACVVVLDEAEKAHPAVLQLLLEVLDQGQLTDGRGRRVDFSAAVVIVALQATTGGTPGERPVGFGASGTSEASGALLASARKALPAELWSRFDERLAFAPLGRPQIACIAERLLAQSSRRLWEERRIGFRAGEGLVELLVSAGGEDPRLGARPLRQAIERLVELPLAERILDGRVRPGERLVLVPSSGGIEFCEDAP